MSFIKENLDKLVKLDTDSKIKYCDYTNILPDG
jgi:hypothetical protein